MTEDVPSRVRALMEATGMTQVDLAARVGMDPTAVSKALHGRRRFSSLELALLAEQLKTTVDHLLTGAAPRAYGVAARTLTDFVDAGVDRAGSIAEAVLERRAAIDELAPPIDPPALLDRSANGAELADQALRLLGTDALLRSTSELLDRIEHVLRIDVVVDDLGPDVDGLAISDGRARLIALACSGRPGRQRFTLGHELGHVLAGDAERALRRESVIALARSAEERRANAFAAAFCMPEDVVRQELASGVGPEELAWRLHVSPDALAWRLLNLRLIREPARALLAASTEREAALAGAHADAFAARIQAARSRRPPRRLVAAYLEAYQRGETTLTAAAELLGVDVHELEDGAASIGPDPLF